VSAVLPESTIRQQDDLNQLINLLTGGSTKTSITAKTGKDLFLILSFGGWKIIDLRKVKHVRLILYLQSVQWQ
jgi:hypothetical protein